MTKVDSAFPSPPPLRDKVFNIARSFQTHYIKEYDEVEQLGYRIVFALHVHPKLYYHTKVDQWNKKEKRQKKKKKTCTKTDVCLICWLRAKHLIYFSRIINL